MLFQLRKKGKFPEDITYLSQVIGLFLSLSLTYSTEVLEVRKLSFCFSLVFSVYFYWLLCQETPAPLKHVASDHTIPNMHFCINIRTSLPFTFFWRIHPAHSVPPHNDFSNLIKWHPFEQHMEKEKGNLCHPGVSLLLSAMPWCCQKLACPSPLGLCVLLLNINIKSDKTISVITKIIKSTS